MVTHLPQNQFISNSTVSPRAVESAVALIAPPVADATAAPNSALASAMTADTAAAPDLTDPPVAAAVLIETPAPAPSKNPDVGVLADTDCIGEIFRYARKLSAEARTFVPDYPDIYQAMLDPNAPRALETDPVWADEPPLFLQKREA